MLQEKWIDDGASFLRNQEWLGTETKLKGFPVSVGRSPRASWAPSCLWRGHRGGRQKRLPVDSAQPPWPSAEGIVIHAHQLSADLSESNPSESTRDCPSPGSSLWAPCMSLGDTHMGCRADPWGHARAPQPWRSCWEKNSHPGSTPLQKSPQDGQSTQNPPYSYWSHLFRTSPSLEHCFHSKVGPVTTPPPALSGSTHPREEAFWFQNARSEDHSPGLELCVQPLG